MMSPRAWEELARFAEILHHAGDAPATKEDLLALLPQADACLTSWDVARLDADVIAAAPKLRAIVHMGGSVKRIVSDAVWERGILVVSAAPVLAEHVAETTLGLMIVGMKRVWPLAQRVRDGGWRDSPYWPSRELYDKKVGIVGASNVGRHVIRLLQPFHVHILLYDPYVSEEQARNMGAAKVELDELVQEADVISLHAPALPATYHMIDARRLSMMKDDALIINTARGSLIDEEALIRELEKGRFFAFLDVTDPEPPAPDSPLRRLPNVVVTPHIAGCIENCTRMGERAVEELRRFFAGEPPLNPITRDALDRVA
ncbi:MAG: hydroxyacid dehydrogenase [Anaerolineae bacterium]|nr:hydroxyacid dehydrogenase [Anaerolineae bacterium]